MTKENQDSKVAATGPSKPPPALTEKSTLPLPLRHQRHLHYDTYSSDDDDVFLPNPPPKTQADKCTTIAMETEEEEDKGRDVSGAEVEMEKKMEAPKIVVEDTTEEKEEQINQDRVEKKKEENVSEPVRKGEVDFHISITILYLFMYYCWCLFAGPSSGTIVIKRGRGAAKSLDREKLQMPLQKGYARRTPIIIAAVYHIYNVNSVTGGVGLFVSELGQTR